ncbi:hypothetical protein ACVWZV_008450 [Bradyrhizobium sp. GM5.1]
MPNAIELIVDGYVRLNNRRALDDLRMQRRKLAVDLKARTGFDFGTTVQQIEEDIAVIEAGLARLGWRGGELSCQSSSRFKPPD